jgi:hypothetical protein
MRSLLLASLALLAMPASAADITWDGVVYGDNNRVAATMSLTGPIQPGDAARVQALVYENLPDYYLSALASITITLDSTGGSFVEGIALMDVFHELAIATRVSSDATCHSACALAFLGGRFINEASLDEVRRTVEPGASLGFHAPSLNLDGDTLLPAAMISESYGEALSAIGELMVRSPVFDIQPSLIQAVISTPPSEMYVLEIVDDFARWGILVDIDQSRWEPDAHDIARMCVNYDIWQEGGSVVALEAQWDDLASQGRVQLVEALASQMQYYEPPNQSVFRTRYAYVTTLDYEWTEICVVQMCNFNGVWRPNVTTSAASAEVTIQGLEEANISANPASILHALPHDFAVAELGAQQAESAAVQPEQK